MFCIPSRQFHVKLTLDTFTAKTHNIQKTKAVVQRRSVKRVFLELLQNSHENTCAKVSFLGLQLYQKRDSGTGVFL